MRKFTLPAILAILIPAGLFAARLTLRDGTTMYGQFVNGDSRTIVFDDEYGARHRYSTNQVQMIDLAAPGYSGGSYNRNYSNRGYNNGYDNNTAYRSDQAGYSHWVNVPAGTQISVRADQGIDSGNAAPGSFYPATIVQDITDSSGAILIPRGSPAQLVLGSDNRGGYFLDLDSVRVNGRRYRVDSSSANVNQGIGANRRTAEYVGGGGALGALVGAIAGGGKGAAIGAVAGAALGGGVQVVTRGHEVRVPAETVLNFRLEQPLALREM